MTSLLWIFFAAMVAVDIWAAGAVVSGSATSRGLRSPYTVVAFLALAATVATTGFLSYFSNLNTHVYGWPIPRVIFQRDTASSPWLDYVGPTVVLAYPMNFIVYMFLPSVAFIGIMLLRRRYESARSFLTLRWSEWRRAALLCRFERLHFRRHRSPVRSATLWTKANENEIL